ncbi:MAG: GNAT family N-acetyltransferase [Sphingomonadales bacterium]|nr:GNAT family N-acetyltransferase [Sphingomonadales bacterium]
MFLFSAIEHGQCAAVHQWHRGFAGANRAIAPRDYDFFELLAWDGCVWAAMSDEGDFLALAYAAFDEDEAVCEIGGLMVDVRYRGNGLGSTVARLALCHALVSENLLAVPGVRIIARVLREPQEMADAHAQERRFTIIEDVLRFRHARQYALQNGEIENLVCDDGFFVVDEYEMVIPDTIAALADWARSWTGFVGGDKPALVEFHDGVDMALWTQALERMLLEHPGTGAGQGAGD